MGDDKKRKHRRRTSKEHRGKTTKKKKPKRMERGVRVPRDLWTRFGREHTAVVTENHPTFLKHLEKQRNRSAVQPKSSVVNSDVLQEAPPTDQPNFYDRHRPSGQLERVTAPGPSRDLMVHRGMARDREQPAQRTEMPLNAKIMVMLDARDARSMKEKGQLETLQSIIRERYNPTARTALAGMTERAELEHMLRQCGETLQSANDNRELDDFEFKEAIDRMAAVTPVDTTQINQVLDQLVNAGQMEPQQRPRIRNEIIGAADRRESRSVFVSDINRVIAPFEDSRPVPVSRH